MSGRRPDSRRRAEPVHRDHHGLHRDAGARSSPARTRSARRRCRPSLRDGAYEIDVVVDPDALLPTLEAYGQQPISRDLPRGERDRRIAGLASVFLERAVVSFDGGPPRPPSNTCPSSAFNDFAQAPSKVRLTGAVPVGARDVRVHLRSRARHLRAERPDRRRPGRRPSGWSAARRARRCRCRRRCRRRRAPRSAWQYFALGFTHILPHGLDHILFVRRHLPADVEMAVDRGAGQHLHHRALDHAGADDVRDRVAAGEGGRADDRAVDRLRRDREPGRQRAEAVAAGAGVLVRPAARDGLRRRAARSRAAAAAVPDRAGRPSTSASKRGS